MYWWTKGPATRNDFVNNIVNDARADAIFATLKAIVDDETSTISLTKSLRVAGPLQRLGRNTRMTIVLLCTLIYKIAVHFMI